MFFLFVNINLAVIFRCSLGISEMVLTCETVEQWTLNTGRCLSVTAHISIKREELLVNGVYIMMLK